MKVKELIRMLRGLEDFDLKDCGITTEMLEALDAQPVVKSQLRWIPVEERLPDEIGNYLVVINCPRGRWDEICTFYGGKEWVSIDEYAEIATKWVTHWMPLPDPPKEVDDGI